MSKVLVGAVVVGGMALLALVSCSTTGSPLDGTRWQLVGWTVSSIDPADVTITASFAAGQVSGNSGVNSYGGAYTLGPGDAFTVGRLVSTLMAGPEPAMRAESAYLVLLGQARFYKITGGTLTLYDQGGNESLIFAAAGTVTPRATSVPPPAPTVTAGIAIRGQVRLNGADGPGLAGVQVYGRGGYGSTEGPARLLATTDEDGLYWNGNAIPGMVVWAELEGYTFEPETWTYLGPGESCTDACDFVGEEAP